MEHLTTPFGRRPLTSAQVHAQTNAAACPNGTKADKWAVVRNIAFARRDLGLGDRAIAVLTALVSFHPDTVLEICEGPQLVVYPSNVQIQQRAHGIAEATLRHHLSALVEAGILIRRDSPNGKRYARKGQSGSLSEAFGFDLAPLVARCAEFEERARTIAAASRVERLARGRVSILRRDLQKLIEWADETSAAGPWNELAEKLALLNAGYPRRPTGKIVSEMNEALSQMMAEAHKHLDSVAESVESDGNDAAIGRHHQSSKTDSHEFGTASETKGKQAVEVSSIPAVSKFPLPMILEACPDIADYSRHGIRSWSNLLNAAELVRGMLGISSNAWSEAQEVMGAEMAAVTIAAILQRSESIHSPNGYLKNLVGRARIGHFSVGPVLKALLRSRSIAVRPIAGAESPTKDGRVVDYIKPL